MSEVQTGFSKRFAIEINTGKTRTEVTSIGSRFDPSTETREVPITKRFPPDRIRSLVTRTTYTRDDSGRLTNPNVKVYQEVSIDQWNSLPDNLKTSDPGQLKYYAQIAEMPAGRRNYIPTNQVIDALYDEEDAKLLKNEAARYEKNEGQFKTVSRVANTTVLKNEDINTNTPDSKNQLGLGSDGPEDIVDEEKDNLVNAPIPFDQPQFRAGTREGYGSLRYPDDLKVELQDVIKFTQLVYGARTFNNTNTGSVENIVTGFGERDLGTPKGTVTLPIQDRIIDTNLANWGSDEMNPLQAFGAAKLMGMSLDNVSKDVNDMLSTVQSLVADKNLSPALQTAVKAFFVSKAVGAQNILSRATGSILNPNVELLFRGPQLRPFSFSFFLTARDDNDARQVKQIIRFFKQGMSVKDTTTDIFLRAPNVFKIEYLHKGVTHPGLNRIKECALTNCSVEYTPANTFSTFEDGTMTAYRISLQFTELTPVTEKDYRTDNNAQIDEYSIGY